MSCYSGCCGLKFDSCCKPDCCCGSYNAYAPKGYGSSFGKDLMNPYMFSSKYFLPRPPTDNCCALLASSCCDCCKPKCCGCGF